MRRTLALLLLPFGLGVTGGTAAAQALPQALETRLQRIEEAFLKGDADALRGSFAASGRMRVDLKGLTEGQESYGAGQLQVIFSQIFELFRTREFSFAAEDVSVPSPGTAFARGRWTRGGRREQVELAETLTFTLRGEASDWRIQEIRSSR